MRIVLIHPNYHSGGAEIAGNWPPAWVAYLAGALKTAGYTSLRFIDAMTHRLSEDEVRRLLAEEKPDLIGCTAITPAICKAERLLRAQDTPRVPVDPRQDQAQVHARLPEGACQKRLRARVLRPGAGRLHRAAVAGQSGLRLRRHAQVEPRADRRVRQGAARPQVAQAAGRGACAGVLLGAIARHAWTFVGSGRFEVRWRRCGVWLSVSRCPLCRELAADAAACGFCGATFERLFGELVRPGTTVTEVECQASGAAACVFEVRW
jgi:hypothetical protein